MTNRQKVELRSSEVRQRLAVLGGTEEQTDEIRAEVGTLVAEIQTLEVRHQALIAAGEEETEETRQRASGDRADDELADLTLRSNVGEVYESAMSGRATAGAIAELQQEYGLDWNQVPLRSLETRAVTPAPTNVGATQASIIPGVFPATLAAWLGVDMPTVGVGEHVYPVLVKNADVGGPHDASQVVASTTGSFTAEVLSPLRLQAEFFYRRVDRARFSGMDAALRQNLSQSLGDAVDKEVMAGVNGFLGASGLTAPTEKTAQAAFGDYRKLVYDAAVLDGLFASDAGSVRLALGRQMYSHAAGLYRANNSDDSAIDSLARVSGGVRIARHIPNPSSGDQELIISKAPTMRNMVAPMWEGVTIIADEITLSAKGEIKITAVLMHNVKILRAAAFSRKTLQITA